MADNLSIQRSSRVSFLGKFPWTFLIIGYMLVVQYTGLDMHGIPGYVFIGLCVLVLFAEFFKSGDISTAAFFGDLLSAVSGVIIATALLSYLYFSLNQTPTFFHWFGYAIIVGDAVISPFNSFRTALRNFGLGG